jgi:hypothetical protein
MWLVAGLLTLEARVISPAIYVKCMEDNESVEQVLLRALPFAPSSIIPPMVHIPPILKTAVISRTRG